MEARVGAYTTQRLGGHNKAIASLVVTGSVFRVRRLQVRLPDHLCGRAGPAHYCGLTLHHHCPCRRGFLATCVGVLTLHILADAKDHPGRLLATKFGRFRDFGEHRFLAWEPASLSRVCVSCLLASRVGRLLAAKLAGFRY